MRPMKEPVVRYNEATRTLESWDERAKSWRTLRTDVSPTSKTARKLQEIAPKTIACYEAMGLLHADAVIAAGVERGVKTGNLNKLFESALALGLSEAEARIFANPTPEGAGLGDLFHVVAVSIRR
jgi:hypothetical protein